MTAVAGGPRDVARTPAPAGAMIGTATAPPPTGVVGPPARAPDAHEGAATVPRAATTNEAQAQVVRRVPPGPTARVTVNGTALAPPVPLTGVPRRTRTAPGPARAAMTGPVPPSAVAVRPTARGSPAAPTGPALPTAVAAPQTALGSLAAVSAPAVVPAARVTATATVGALPAPAAVAPGRPGSSPGRGRRGPAGRCRPDGAASPAMAPGTWRRAHRRRRSGPKPVGKGPGAGPSDQPCPRIFGPSAHLGPASRPERARLAPAMLWSTPVRPLSRRPALVRRGSVPHGHQGGPVPGPPRRVARSGPPANR
jgi:hypothetical protein